MTTEQPDTEELLRQAEDGDPGARDGLLARHRDRLRKMNAWRLDQRLAARVDPSDVVQEVLLEASGKMERYLRERPLPFFPWLRALAGERLATLHRRHIRARGRSVLREEAGLLNLPDESAAELAARLVTSSTSPRSGRCGRSSASACSMPWGSFPSGTARCWCSATWNSSRSRA